MSFNINLKEKNQKPLFYTSTNPPPIIGESTNKPSKTEVTNSLTLRELVARHEGGRLTNVTNLKSPVYDTHGQHEELLMDVGIDTSKMDRLEKIDW